MRRFAVVFFALAVLFALPGAALADHPAPGGALTPPGPEPVPNQGGEGAEWELIETVLTGNPHTDLDFFTQGGATYASVGTLATGGNQGGQTIVKLTDDQGNVSRDTIEYVSGHPSATCISDPIDALGLQHDVEATPKGTFTNWTDTQRVDGDAQLLLDATDNPTRCHDQGLTGLDLLGLLGPPQGGLEIIDISNIEEPVEIGLTSHIGEAHTVNIDPRRPHIAYAVTSDAVSVSKDANDADGDGDTEELIRENEIEGDNDALDLDGFEVVDLSSCMNVNDRASFAPNASVEEKRGVDPATGEPIEGAGCRPEVFRYRYDTLAMALGHTLKNADYGCHELEIFPNDLLTCGGGNAMIMLDMSGAFDDMGTPNDFTDDKPRGEPLPCRLRESTSSPLFQTGAMITDCVVGEGEVDLRVPNWLNNLGAPSLEGVKHIGSAHHQGRGADAEDGDEESAEEGEGVTSKYSASQDIDFNHEAELTHSGKFVISTDERGGGVAPPGASCSPGIDNPDGNGGLHAYAVERLDKKLPGSAKEAWDAYAYEDALSYSPKATKAIVRATIQTTPQASLCTAHVFQQVPGQNRIFMGWYSQGTRVFDYKENPDGTFEFAEVAYFIPTNANEWTSHVFKFDENDDGTFTYYGAATDFNIGLAGRNAVDIYKVTLPPVGAAFGEDEDRDPDTDPDPTDPTDDPTDPVDDGVGDEDDNRTLPATGGGFGLIPAALGLLGTAAWLGRSRRNRDEGPPADN